MCDEPINVKEDLVHDEATQWKKDIEEEMRTLT